MTFLHEPYEDLSVAITVASARGKIDPENQDKAKSWYTTPPALQTQFPKGALFAVADGMGGQGPKGAGRKASDIAITKLGGYYTHAFPSIVPLNEQLDAVIFNAHQTILQEAQKNPAQYHDMGSTVAAALLVRLPDSDKYHAHIANVGDSRVYYLREAKTINQFTIDDNHPDQASHLVQYLGQPHTSNPYFNIHHTTLEDLASGDYFILCTDGVYKAVSDDELLAVVQREIDPQQIAKKIRELHFKRGAKDDLGLVVVEIN